MKKEENRSSIGNMEAKVICLIGYLGAIILLWMGGLAFFSWALPLGIYILETKNEYVKKQMIQATLFFLIVSLIFAISNIFWGVLFPSGYTLSFNLRNFEGSTLAMTAVYIIITTFLVIMSLIGVIACSKVWNYKEYNIFIINKYTQKFRNKIDSIIGITNVDEKNNQKSNTDVGTNTNSTNTSTNNHTNNNNNNNNSNNSNNSIEHDKTLKDTLINDIKK